MRRGLAVFVLACGSAAAQTYVNSGQSHNNGSNPATITISIAAGHTIVLAGISGSGEGAMTPADSASDTFSNIIGPITESASGTVLQMWCTVASSAVTSVQITVATDVGSRSLVVWDYSGMPGTCAPDKTNSGLTTSSGAYSSGSTGTLTQASEVVFAVIGSKNSSCTWTSVTGTFTSHQSAITSFSFDAIDQVVSSTAALTAAATCSTDSGSYGATIIGSIKASGGGAAASPHLTLLGVGGP